jgi:hypothetical protein
LMYGMSEGPFRSWSSPLILLSCLIGVVLLGAMAMVNCRRPGLWWISGC